MNCTMSLVGCLALVGLCHSAGLCVPLNDGWTVDGKPLSLPHCWNIDDGTDGPDDPFSGEHDSVAGTGYQRKRMTYRRVLPAMLKGKCYYLRVNAASIHATVKLDGVQLIHHDGAFTSFTVQIPEGRDGRTIEIVVDNFIDRDVPPVCGDFTMYGGLYRGVEWIEASPARKFIPEDGLFEDEIALSDEFPKYEFRDDGFFYVDGVKTFLKGVNYHQDREGKGWAISDADMEEDIRLIKCMGANAIRTSHYPRSESFYDLCDKYGIYVWCEAPVVDEVTDSEKFRQNYRRVVREMVLQHRRHKCIAMWSLFNELYLKKMPDGLAEPMVVEANEIVKELDPAGRPTVAGTFKPDKVELNSIPDGIGFNMYCGWYWGKNEEFNSFIEDWRTRSKRKAVCISEFGAGGSIGHKMPIPNYKPSPNGYYHPCDFQLNQHRSCWNTIKSNSHIWGCFIWQMFDSGSDTRHEGRRNGINDKGLVEFDHKTLKPAFEFYRKEWNEASGSVKTP